MRRKLSLALFVGLHVVGCDRHQDDAPTDPVDSGDVTLSVVALGNTQACGLRADGQPICWGATEAEIERGTDDLYYYDGDPPSDIQMTRLHFSSFQRAAYPQNSASGRVCGVFDDPTYSCCWGRATQFDLHNPCHYYYEASADDPGFIFLFN